MSSAPTFPSGTCYVVDRDDVVWLLVYDGGMATRATEDGVVTAGIAWLEETAGPLMPLDAAAARRAALRVALWMGGDSIVLSTEV